MKIYRHGDLSFHPIEKLPEGLKKSKDNVLARGEHTGHKHIITAEVGNCDVYQNDKTGELVVVVDGKASLVHEEHKTLIFETGIYRMKQEREFDYFSGIILQVRD